MVPLTARMLLPLLLLGAAATHPQEAHAQEKEEGPRIRFAGNETVAAAELREAAQRKLKPVLRGEGSPADVADAAYIMETWMREQGYPDARISFRMLDTSSGGEEEEEEEEEVRRSSGWPHVDTVEFVVREGRRAYLGMITFSGVSAFETERLRAFFPDSRRPFGGSGTVFRRREILDAVARVKRLYTINGYIRADVGPHEIETREADGKRLWDVRVPVREGPQYVIRSVAMEAPDLTPETVQSIRSAIGLTDEPYFPRQAAIGAVTIRSRLGRLGYLAEVEYSTELTADGTVHLTYVVNSGPHLVLRSVVVRNRGSRPLTTREPFIRSYVKIEPGETVNTERVEQAETALYGLGLFTLVDISVEPASNEDRAGAETHPADVVVSVSEARNRFLELTVGWGSYELLRGSVRYANRNLFGLGRSWSISGQGSIRSLGVSTTLSDPVLFGPQGTISLLGSYHFRDAPSFDNRVAEGRLSYVHTLSRHWSLSTSYRFTYSLAQAVEAEAGDAEDAALRTGRLGGGLDYDSRDSAVLPQKGAVLSLSAFYSSLFLGSEIDFAGLDSRFSFYIPFFSRLVLSANWVFATRVLLEERTTLPIQERLFLGGANSVRSFGTDQLGPTTADGVPMGGLTSLQATAELRLKIVGGLHLAAFYDVGMIDDDQLAVAGAYGHALGGGLRYYLPVGPIRLDAAYNPGRLYAAGARWAVHFAVGFAF